ncbi:zinc finger and SCAN domain-containing protein 31-like isoform X3 [Trichoplusia ni]|uniref:Zinc finger and SCAN domain-containing protein 31-like isoform X3 n=1 Tax=Trichoplusia ni TaxID=7111 RepID=A0A7E5WTX2_TRINI|nr:zinc finger and SCAN domain-containing protein 31-like isoform X3 [Trichoplusia ni]
MSNDSWKLESDLCRCCHSEGKFKNLSMPCKNSDFEEIYSDMLKNCFDISLEPIEGLLCTATYTICDGCICRLRDATDFRKQVLACEERFRDMYDRNVFKATEPVVVGVKDEPDTFTDADEEFKKESSQDDNDEFEDSLDMHYEDDHTQVVESTKKKKKSKKTDKKGCRAVGRPRKEKQDSLEDEQGKKKGATSYYTVTQNSYKCNICAKSYASQPLVSQHYRFVHLKRRPKDRKCPKCDERIPGYLRAKHLEKKHGIPAPTCGVCNKKFRFPCNVLQHQRKVHMGEKKVCCQVCDKSFFDNLTLKLHMATHSEEKRFKCSICGKMFRWENNLKDHVKIHTGEKKFACCVCEKAFIQKSTLKQHIGRNHPGVDKAQNRLPTTL